MSGSGYVVLAVHRPDPELLRRQVESLRAQDLTTWTCLVGLDGRDEQVGRLVETLVSGDDRFTVRVYDDNVGHYRHFERLLAETPADASWVALCDQDDRWHPDKLSVLVDLLDRDASVTWVLGQANVTDRAGAVLGRTDRHVDGLPALLLKNQVTGAFLVARRSLLGTALPFPEGTPAARHDHWLGVAGTATGRVVVHDGVLQDYVQHEGNAIGEADPSRSAHRPTGRLSGLDRVSLDVWGWRVAMARAVLTRVPDLAGRDRAMLRAVARGAFSLPLARELAREARRRRVRPAVVAGTTGAALWWPVARRRRDA